VGRAVLPMCLACVCRVAVSCGVRWSTSHPLALAIARVTRAWLEGAAFKFGMLASNEYLPALRYIYIYIMNVPRLARSPPCFNASVQPAPLIPANEVRVPEMHTS